MFPCILEFYIHYIYTSIQMPGYRKAVTQRAKLRWQPNEMFFFLAVIESWLHVFVNMPWQISFIDTCICLYRLLLCQKIQTKKIQLVLLEWQRQSPGFNLEVVASFSHFIVVKWMEVSISQVCSTNGANNTYRQKEKVTNDLCEMNCVWFWAN